jgi:hypothetical protein
MRKLYPFLLLAIVIASSFRSQAQSVNHLVISQVYGGGGNSGATYKNDFIELFNPTGSTIDLSGWSVQYTSSTGTSWAVTALTGSIAPGHYFLVQEAAGTGGTVNLPSPDVTGTLALSGTAGKVALVNSSTALSGSCPATGIIDLVGFGAANCSEGTGPTAALTNTTAAIRISNGCTDTNNNSSDFSTSSAPNPRNSSSPVNICGIVPPAFSAFPSNLTGFTTSVGTPSASQTVNVTGINLTDFMAVMATPPYEVSLDNVTFSPGIILPTASGVAAGTIYVRISSSASVGAANSALTMFSGSFSNTVPLAGTVTPLVTVNPPQSFTAATVSASQIALSATGNASGNNILVAYNTSSLFGTPSGVLSTGSNITGGGSVLYNGPSAGFNMVQNGLSPSTNYYYSAWSVDASNNYSTPVTAMAVTSAPPNPHVVINQVYGGGGNSGATYKNDFIELYNNENVAVTLAGMSVQYASTSGTFTQSTPLSGTIPAHGFYLVQEAAGASGTVNLPTPDATGSINMSGTGGKVALVNGTTALGVACPTTPNLIDLVGYGAATCFEGSAPASTTTNSTAVIRVPDGDDTNDNAADFQLTAPNPRNRPYSTTAPVITALNPADNDLNVPSSNVTTIIFDKPVQKGTGNITVYQNGVALAPINVNSPAVTVSGNTVNVAVSYAPAKSYYILVDAGALKDAFGNNFAGISNPATWNFATILLTPPVTFDFQKCTGSGLLPDGFTQFSETGSAVWDCTSFGRDPNNPSSTAAFPNAVQINGFANGTNVPNIDWLISPSIDLTSTTFPLLSYWSRTAFNGLPLQLKVSTDYVSGDPRLATWTDINGKFPLQTSNVWTLSDNINLSAFKAQNVHFAFVYESTDEDGARWTIDDVSLANSLTPPPPALTTSTTDVQFTFVASGAKAVKTFSFTGNDLTGGVTVSSTGAFEVSKDGISFSPSISYSVEEANNVNEKVYVRFAPTQKNQDYTGTVSVSTSGLSNTVNLKGTSIDPATTLEVVNWNIEWFGSTVNGPTNDDQQQQNVKTVLQNVGADIYGLLEVVDESRLANIVSQMPGYSYVVGQYGSHVNPPDPSGGPLSEAQKLGFVYKTSMFSNISVRPLINNQNTSSVSYNNWSSGRYPFLMTADVTLNCVTKRINFILVHAKANTSPTATAYARRQAAANELHDTIQTYFADKNVIMLGDFNDDLDQTITAGITPPVTSYSSFTTDNSNFFSPTLALSLAGKRSTVSYNDVIDHVMLSNEMEPYYMPSTASILTDVTSLVSNYGTTTTDHYPVFTRYKFEAPAVPVVTTCPTPPAFCATTTGTYTIPSFAATSVCGSVDYSFVVTGATSRTGTTNDASGHFEIGTSTIKWLAVDAAGDTATCETTVVVNANPVVTIPDAYVLKSGVLPNTVYLGYEPASSITLTSMVSGGSADYSYLWSSSSRTSTTTVSPTSNTVYVVTVTDANGCQSVASKTVSVMDIRAGNKMDKILVCHKSANTSSIQIDPSAAPAHLSHGDMLGSCQTISPAVTGRFDSQKEPISELQVKSSPNPSSSYFLLSLNGGTSSEKINIRITDISGRTVEVKKSLFSNSNVVLGSSYLPGIYFAEVTQGAVRKQIKLLKL